MNKEMRDLRQSKKTHMYQIFIYKENTTQYDISDNLIDCWRCVDYEDLINCLEELRSKNLDNNLIIQKER